MLKYELKQSLRSSELSKDWEGWQNGYCAGLENLWAKALRGSSPLPSASYNFMKLGIILQSNKPEHAWNTFRLEIFLMNEGSELDTIPDSCGTCLKLRGKEENKVYPISTMSDLLKMVENSDKVLVFG